ncbi:MAG TPA: SUMF1/EgtB/PvdO family nonheme iron enzyme [Bacillota bacterium]
MKKLLPISLTVMMILAVALSGCGGGNNGDNPPTLQPVSITESLVAGAAGLTVTYPYYMAQTEVTYQIWSTVKNWATANGYTFANPGSCGGYYNKSTGLDETYTSDRDTDPVTEINWRDAIVWCNALTEYYNAKNGKSWSCAYTSGGAPIRDSQNNTGVIDNLTDDGHTAKGFRLPTDAEWYLAARYIDGSTWTPDNYASGATAGNANATKEVAWYYENSESSTHPVGLKNANALGIKDMSGNVIEWCFDISGSGRLERGGCWFNDADMVTVGGSLFINCLAGDISNAVGFRPVRTQ